MRREQGNLKPHGQSSHFVRLGPQSRRGGRRLSEEVQSCSQSSRKYLRLGKSAATIAAKLLTIPGQPAHRLPLRPTLAVIGCDPWGVKRKTPGNPNTTGLPGAHLTTLASLCLHHLMVRSARENDQRRFHISSQKASCQSPNSAVTYQRWPLSSPSTPDPNWSSSTDPGA